MTLTETPWRMINVAGLMLALGLALVGCGPAGEGTVDQSSANRNSAAKADATGDPNDQAVKYAQCMREHGITDFPDPVDGKLQLTVRKGTDLDPSSPRFQSAQQACKALEPPGLTNGSGQSNGGQAAGVKFAACMRKNGVPDFPDPQNGRMLMGGGIDPNSPAFRSAVAACRDLAPAGMVGGGQ